MGLKLKNGVNPEVLRNYGFSLGKEFFGKERWCGNGCGYQCEAEWYHKFLRIDRDTGEYSENPDYPIAYTDEEFVPMVHIALRIGDGDDLYIDCAPLSTYNICGDELDIVSNTIYDLVSAGLMEKL